MKRFIYYSKRVIYNILYYYRVNKRFEKLDLPTLTKEEKKAIRDTWPGVVIIPFDWICVRIYKKIYGFSRYYLAPCWWNEIRTKINPRDQLFFFRKQSDVRCLFPIYLIP